MLFKEIALYLPDASFVKFICKIICIEIVSQCET
nr:MAG TPA: hypothetical protein [Caudoviricetes sp.]